MHIGFGGVGRMREHAAPAEGGGLHSQRFTNESAGATELERESWVRRRAVFVGKSRASEHDLHRVDGRQCDAGRSSPGLVINLARSNARAIVHQRATISPEVHVEVEKLATQPVRNRSKHAWHRALRRRAKQAVR